MQSLSDTSSIVRVRTTFLPSETDENENENMSYYLKTKRARYEGLSLEQRLRTPSMRPLAKPLKDMFEMVMSRGKLPIPMREDKAGENTTHDEDQTEDIEAMRRRESVQDQDDLLFGDPDHQMDSFLNDDTHHEDHLQKDDHLDDMIHNDDELDQYDRENDVPPPFDHDDDDERGEYPSLNDSNIMMESPEDFSLASVNDLQGQGKYHSQHRQEDISIGGAGHHKWHPHTIKVMGFLRRKISREQPTTTYQTLMKPTQSRRTAAAFFFEMLQLKTLNYVDVDQSTPYGDIQIKATEHFHDPIPTLDN